MIRYVVSKKGKTAGADLAELGRRVTKEKPTWLARARKRTDKLAKAKCYNENSSIWREITGVYRKLQHHKCAYCERKVREDCGELEHFRPKSEVKQWPPTDDERVKRRLKHLGNLKTGAPLEVGYHRLAYALLNYAMACHDCNAILKKCYFPVAGTRKKRAARDPRKYLQERPYLIYPIGVLDEDPEDLIYFLGSIPLPVDITTSSFPHRRALITILLFNLRGDSTLLLERSIVIKTLYKALEGKDPDDIKTVKQMISGHGTHTNCCRSFVRAYQKDQRLAKKLYEKANRYIDTKIPTS